MQTLTLEHLHTNILTLEARLVESDKKLDRAISFIESVGYRFQWDDEEDITRLGGISQQKAADLFCCSQRNVRRLAAMFKWVSYKVGIRTYYHLLPILRTIGKHNLECNRKMRDKLDINNEFTPKL